jgi:hypothetical protein
MFTYYVMRFNILCTVNAAAVLTAVTVNRQDSRLVAGLGGIPKTDRTIRR